MAALETLFAPEPDLSAAIVALLASDSLNVSGMFSTDKVATPWVGIRVDNLVESGRKYQHTDGIFYSDSWSFILTVAVLTDRRENSADHFSYVGTVRKFLAQRLLASTGLNARLSNHVVADLESVGSSTELADDAKDHERTDLQYQGRVMIKSGAWPS